MRKSFVYSQCAVADSIATAFVIFSSLHFLYGPIIRTCFFTYTECSHAGFLLLQYFLFRVNVLMYLICRLFYLLNCHTCLSSWIFSETLSKLYSDWLHSGFVDQNSVFKESVLIIPLMGWEASVYLLSISEFEDQSWQIYMTNVRDLHLSNRRSPILRIRVRFPSNLSYL